MAAQWGNNSLAAGASAGYPYWNELEHDLEPAKQ